MNASCTFAVAVLAALPLGAAASAATRVERIDDTTVELLRTDATPVDVWISGDPELDRNDTRIRRHFAGETLRIAMPAETRQYLIIVPARGRRVVVAERLLPLQQGSNFRDLGGYPTRDGRSVRWGKVFRSAAMPLLTERDYRMLAGLGLDSVVDLRSLPERELMPDQLDDRSGALFLSNDYPLAQLMSHMGQADGDEMYKGLEQLLVPQFRMALARILAAQGAVVVHDVWGQDRVGVFAALLYDVLGVDRATIREDFHLSQKMRRTEFEISDLRPEDYPGNPIVQYYASKKVNGRYEPEALYTRSGVSHIDQFLAYIDRQYGGSEHYFATQLGLTPARLSQLRTTLLD